MAISEALFFIYQECQNIYQEPVNAIPSLDFHMFKINTEHVNKAQFFSLRPLLEAHLTCIRVHCR